MNESSASSIARRCMCYNRPVFVECFCGLISSNTHANFKNNDSFRRIHCCVGINTASLRRCRFSYLFQQWNLL